MLKRPNLERLQQIWVMYASLKLLMELLDKMYQLMSKKKSENFYVQSWE